MAVALRIFAKTPSSLCRARGKVSTFHQQNQAHEGGPTGPNDMATSVGLCTREGALKGGGHLRPERYGNERWFVYTRGRPQGGRAPSRGEGTHKGCPYGPNDMATSDRLCTREGAHKGGGHPQGAPLRARTIWQRAIGCAHERAPSRGEGTHKGRPYGPNDMATSDRLCA